MTTDLPSVEKNFYLLWLYHKELIHNHRDVELYAAHTQETNIERKKKSHKFYDLCACRHYMNLLPSPKGIVSAFCNRQLPCISLILLMHRIKVQEIDLLLISGLNISFLTFHWQAWCAQLIYRQQDTWSEDQACLSRRLSRTISISCFGKNVSSSLQQRTESLWLTSWNSLLKRSRMQG